MLDLDLLLAFFTVLSALGLGLTLWWLRARAAPALETRIAADLTLHRQAVAALLHTLATHPRAGDPALRERLLANLRLHRDGARRLGAGAELAAADAALGEAPVATRAPGLRAVA